MWSNERNMNEWRIWDNSAVKNCKELYRNETVWTVNIISFYVDAKLNIEHLQIILPLFTIAFIISFHITMISGDLNTVGQYYSMTIWENERTKSLIICRPVIIRVIVQTPSGDISCFLRLCQRDRIINWNTVNGLNRRENWDGRISRTIYEMNTK